MCMDPDVVVLVGLEQEQFQCYRVVLTLSSDVFYAMLSNSMSENERSTVVLPDMEPAVWKLFYSFIDPRSHRSAKITKFNIAILVPLFHRYHMIECDEILKKVVEAVKTSDFDCCGSVLDKLLPCLSMSATFGLQLSYEIASEKGEGVQGDSCRHRFNQENHSVFCNERRLETFSGELYRFTSPKASTALTWMRFFATPCYHISYKLAVDGNRPKSISKLQSMIVNLLKKTLQNRRINWKRQKELWRRH